MTRSSMFEWQQGAGWLILGPRSDTQTGPSDAIDSRVLTRGAADGPLVYIWAANDLESADQYLDYVQELGGQAGYPVDIVSDDDETLTEQLAEAGVIVIGDGPHTDRLFNSLHGAAIRDIQLAFEQGAVVYGAGLGAEVLGQWFLHGSDSMPRKGFGWLANAAILTDDGSQAMKEQLQRLLLEEPTAFGLGIGANSALAFGPDGQVEAWGDRHIAISLGKAYATDE